MRLPLLAIMSWSLLSILESLVMRGTLISVRSTAMSPVLLAVLIFAWRERTKWLETGNQKKRRIEEVRWELRLRHLHTWFWLDCGLYSWMDTDRPSAFDRDSG